MSTKAINGFDFEIFGEGEPRRHTPAVSLSGGGPANIQRFCLKAFVRRICRDWIQRREGSNRNPIIQENKFIQKVNRTKRL